ncbi:hypothetical protein LP52_06940 [Streptomonospora alba]|uniref:Uncharacterized protein n=1 Tax=Streptomonospora alba TaxID=183763 RepID=A0A0C2JDX6_9ACTN|nr:hypothetical protein LP52_06940 [Streptomonospora alba]
MTRIASRVDRRRRLDARPAGPGHTVVDDHRSHAVEGTEQCANERGADVLPQNHSDIPASGEPFRCDDHAVVDDVYRRTRVLRSNGNAAGLRCRSVPEHEDDVGRIDSRAPGPTTPVTQE